MSKKSKIEIEYSIIDRQFRNTIETIKKSVATLNKEFGLQKEEMKLSASETEKLQAKLDNLNGQHDLAKQRVEQTRLAMENAKKTVGENSEEYRIWNNHLLDAEKNQQFLANQITVTTSKLEEAKQAEERLGQATSKNVEESQKRQQALSELSREQDKLQSSNEKLTKEMDLQLKTLGDNASETEKNKVKQEYFSKQLENSVESVRNLENQLAIAKQEYGANSEQVDKLEHELLEAKIATKEFETELANVSNNAVTIGKRFEELGASISEIGKRLTTRLTLPLVGVGAGAVKVASDFESAFAGVMKTVDEVVDSNGKVIISYDDLKQGIRDMTKEIPASAEEISAVAESAGQLGIKTENVLEFTRTMIDMGESTNLSADEAATAIARFANITGMSQSEFDRFGSTIVDLGNSFATTEKEIVDMSLRLAGAGAQIGMSEAEIAGFATALSSVGIEAEAGGSAFSKLMVQMQLASETGLTARKELEDHFKTFGFSIEQVVDAVYGKNKEMMESIESATKMNKKTIKEWFNDVQKAESNLRNFADVTGLTMEQFAEVFGKDASNAISMFIGGLSNAEEQGKSAIAVLDDMGITEVRLRDALLRASGAQETFNEAQEIGKKAWEENTALTEEATKRYETFEAKLRILKNELKNVMIDIGEPLMDVGLTIVEALKPALQTVGTLAKKFNEADPSIQKFIIGIGAVVAALGPALFVVGKVVSVIGTISGALGVMSGTVATATPAMLGLAKVFGVVTSVGSAIAGVLGSVVATIGGVIASIGALPIAIGAAVIAIGVVIYKNWDEIKTWTIETWDSIINYLSDKWNNLTGIVSSAWESIKETSVSIWTSIRDALAPIVETIAKVVEIPISLLATALEALWLVIKAIALVTWEIIKSQAETIWKGIEIVIISPMKSMYDFLADLFNKLGDWLSDKWNSIKLIASIGWNGIKEAIIVPAQNIFNSVSSVFTNMWNKIGEIFDGIIGTAREKFNRVKDAIMGPIDSAKSLIESAVDGISRAFGRIRLPSFSLRRKTFSFGDVSFDLPTGVDVTWHAKGGIFDGVQVLGGHGFGEAGKEAIVPLEHRGHMQPFAKAIAENLEMLNSKDNRPNVFMTMENKIEKDVDMDTVFRRVEQTFTRKGFEIGFGGGNI